MNEGTSSCSAESPQETEREARLQQMRDRLAAESPQLVKREGPGYSR